MNEQVDLNALYAALDTLRESKGLSWREIAEEIGVSASTLTRLGQGANPDINSFAKMVNWLGATANDFFLASGSRPAPKAKEELLVVVSRHLRASKELDPRSAKALENIIQAAYTQMKGLKEK